jgi:chitin synthase
MFLAIKGVQQVSEAERRGAKVSDLFTNSIFRDIVISLSATIGLYVLASLIHVRGFFWDDGWALIIAPN